MVARVCESEDGEDGLVVLKKKMFFFWDFELYDVNEREIHKYSDSTPRNSRLCEM